MNIRLTLIVQIKYSYNSLPPNVFLRDMGHHVFAASTDFADITDFVTIRTQNEI
jgi:hypothetical protein